MKVLSNLFIIFFTISSIFAQDTTKVLVNKNFKFKEGIFITFNQVQANNPIPKSNIITSLDKNSVDFFEQLFKSKIIVFYDNDGQKYQLESENIWGFSQKGKLFVYWDSKPAMIPILGTISHFIASHIEYYYSNNYDPYSYYYAEPNKRVENKQYILYFPTGQILEFNYLNIDPIFSEDNEIYKEWSDLSKRKKKKLIFVYLRKFNLKHPLFLPK